MYERVLKSVGRVLALTLVAIVPVALSAQVAAKSKGYSGDDSASKWDIFAGYSYLAPKGNVNGLPLQAIDYGSIYSVSRYFSKYVGLQLEADEHILNEASTYPACGGCGSTWSADDFSGGGGGLVVRLPSNEVTPFAHALIGVDHVGFLPTPKVSAFGPVLTVGGGLDYATPFFNHHLAIRLFQADYQYTHENWGPGFRGNFNMARLSAGFVYHIGTLQPPPPVTLACSASPESVYPGDPVTITGTAGGLDPKLSAVYTWSGTGVTGKGATASVATGPLAAGSYTVTGEVKEGKAGHEGMKPGESANCSASFTVKAYEPPTISCSASPSTIQPGASSTITSVGMSPQNRPLTYSYTTTGGTISGSGTTAEFSSAGAPTGEVGVTCTVADDKGQTASANTNITIVAPVVAPAIPHTQALCSISFSTDKARPTRVDNEAKACLDEVALDLQRQADATAVVVGEADTHEKEITAREEKFAAHHKHAKVENFAAQRAVNAKDYLVTEKGIDASRVTALTGSTDGKTVEDYLVPAGATFTNDVQGTTPVDPSVKPIARKPLGAKHSHKK